VIFKVGGVVGFGKVVGHGGVVEPPRSA
jgi:hypothetical protein